MSRLAEEGFARAALQSGCRLSAGLAEARALMGTGRPEQAERVLAALKPASPAEAVKLAVFRARNLFWALDRPADAEAVLLDAELRGTPELVALRARFAFALGEPRTAIALAEPIEADGRAPEPARRARPWPWPRRSRSAGAATRRSPSRAAGKRTPSAGSPAPRRSRTGSRTTMTARSSTPSAPTRPPPTRRARPSPHSSSATSGSHAATSTRALRWFRESSVLLRSSDPVRMRPAALAGIAQVAAQAGDAAHARAVVAQLDNAPGRGVGEELGLARAWTAHVSGDRTGAVRIATAVADAATARGALGFAARAHRERARLS